MSKYRRVMGFTKRRMLKSEHKCGCGSLMFRSNWDVFRYVCYQCGGVEKMENGEFIKLSKEFGLDENEEG